MSAEEDFLARWSRRKSAAAEPVDAKPPQSTPDDKNPENKNKNENAKPEAEFDLSSLPPIESITSATDVTAFLRAGVPAELTRAALRRAWSADPVIRDFIGLAENAWDFTKPNEMAGFGPIGSAEDVRKLLAEIMGGAERAVESAAAAIPGEKPQVPLKTNDSRVVEPPALRDAPGQQARLAQDQAGKDSVSAAACKESAPDGKDDTAAQNRSPEAEDRDRLLRRTHGGALPH